MSSSRWSYLSKSGDTWQGGLWQEIVLDFSYHPLWHTTPLLSYKVKRWQVQLKISQSHPALCKLTQRKTGIEQISDLLNPRRDLWPSQIKISEFPTRNMSSLHHVEKLTGTLICSSHCGSELISLLQCFLSSN